LVLKSESRNPNSPPTRESANVCDALHAHDVDDGRHRTRSPRVRQSEEQHHQELPIYKGDTEDGAAQIDHPAYFGEKCRVVFDDLPLPGDVVADRGFHLVQLVLEPLIQIPILLQKTRQPLARESLVSVGVEG
jgi:hypothetical protein